MLIIPNYYVTSVVAMPFCCILLVDAAAAGARGYSRVHEKILAGGATTDCEGADLTS
jgi:hypothetical protein